MILWYAYFIIKLCTVMQLNIYKSIEIATDHDVLLIEDLQNQLAQCRILTSIKCYIIDTYSFYYSDMYFVHTMHAVMQWLYFI